MIEIEKIQQMLGEHQALIDKKFKEAKAAISKIDDPSQAAKMDGFLKGVMNINDEEAIRKTMAEAEKYARKL